MSRLLPRFIDTHVADEQKLARILIDVGASTRPEISLATAEAQDLRGIPVIAMGVSGTSPHTDPLRETIYRSRNW